jgi:23S rRNA pseudouridine955/2504/2580 synthase
MALNVLVAPDEEGLRLDRWLRRHYPALTQGRIEKLVRTGQIRLDGGRVRASARIEPGQKVRLPPEVATLEARPTKPCAPVSRADAAALRAAVLHRDDEVIAIDKPPGLAVQGGTRTTRHLDAMLDALRFGAEERPRLVHRLDKDTSGVLLLARSAAAAAWLTAAFRRKETLKTYWALTAGVPRPREGRIELALAKGARRRAREKVMADAEEGRRAVTNFRVVEAAGRKAAWVELEPLTGRTHQLRVHMAAIGAPILGDGKYGGKGAFIAGLGNRLHLHARSIALPRPQAPPLRITAPLHEHMRETWRFFGFAETTA